MWWSEVAYTTGDWKSNETFGHNFWPGLVSYKVNTCYCSLTLCAHFVYIVVLYTGGNIHENFVYQPYLRIWHQKLIPSPPKAMSKYFFHNKKLWQLCVLF